MKLRLLLACACAALIVAGCGDDKKSDADRKVVAAAQVEKVAFHDWQSLELRNGLLKLAVVPRLGGRLMSYEFDGRSLLYANPKRLGQTPGEDPAKHEPVAKVTAATSTVRASDAAAPAAPAASTSASAPALVSPYSTDYANYGGACAWPLPTTLWSAAWPPPASLDLGDYRAEPQADAGSDEARLTLTSPADEKLGLKLTRTFSLPRAASALRIVTRLTNTGKAAVTAGLQDTSQHPGSLATGETFSKEARAFLPLNAASPLDKHFAALLGKDTQYAATGNVLTVTYGGEEALVGGDSTQGWVAYADARHNVVLAKIATLPADGKYADRNLTSTVYAAPSAKESYLGLSLRSPLTELAPEKSLEFEVWYGAAHCPLPIVGATRAGVVGEPLSVTRMRDSVTLKGTFGVFYSGFAQVAFLDKAGAELGRTEQMAVSPLEAYRLDTLVPLPAGAVKAVLRILTRDRIDVAPLSQADVTEPPTVAPAAPAKKATEPV